MYHIVRNSGIGNDTKQAAKRVYITDPRGGGRRGEKGSEGEEKKKKGGKGGGGSCARRRGMRQHFAGISSPAFPAD